MPAHWSRHPDRAVETDLDHDVDVFEPSTVDGADEEAPAFHDNPVFRTPTPGDAISEERLENDLENE